MKDVSLRKLLEKNAAWAQKVREQNPDFFEHLALNQQPDFLWIGCSDSRIPATKITDLPPGEVFVHRNIANLVFPTDLNCLSVVQYAVEVLQVKHIIVCGHYGCGGIRAAMEDQDHGLIDNWLEGIRSLARRHASALKELTEEERLDFLCEQNVVRQVKNVSNTTIVRNAWKNGADLQVHGWIYSIKDGLLKDLEVTRKPNEER